MNSYSVLISKHYFQNLQMQNWSIFILLKMHQESQKWEWRFLTFRLQYKCLYGNYMYEAIKSTAMEFSLYNVACCQSYHICCNISYLCSRATSQLALKTHTYSEMHTHTHRHTGTHTDTLAKSIIFSLTWQTSTPEPLCGMRVFHPAKSWFQNLCIKLYLLFFKMLKIQKFAYRLVPKLSFVPQTGIEYRYTVVAPSQTFTFELQRLCRSQCQNKYILSFIITFKSL